MTNTPTTDMICPTCEWHYPAHLFAPVFIDEMGNPNNTINVCPDCARHALPNE